MNENCVRNNLERKVLVDMVNTAKYGHNFINYSFLPSLILWKSCANKLITLPQGWWFFFIKFKKKINLKMKKKRRGWNAMTNINKNKTTHEVFTCINSSFYSSGLYGWWIKECVCVCVCVVVFANVSPNKQERYVFHVQV